MMPAGLLLAVMLFLAQPAQPPTPTPETRAETGRIAGIVEVSSALASRRPRFRIYSDAGQGSVPPASAGDDLARELRNVVVYVDASNSTAAGPANARDTSMAQEDERFVPHVLPVVQGSRVAFPNHDAIYHNVFSLSSARTFDLGRYPRGDAKTVTFTKPGVVQVFCHIHSDMNAVVLVLPNAHFAAPDGTGRYVIENVAPGEYTVVGWHERARPISRRIRVVAGRRPT